MSEALAGRFSDHHGVVAGQISAHIAFLDASIASLTAEIAERVRPFEPAIELLCGIPGWGRGMAEVFIALGPLWQGSGTEGTPAGQPGVTG